MPIYEYRCEACGFELEKIQKMSDAPIKDCPSCKKPALRKLISAAGFRLVGGGWYETDFKSGKKRNLNEDTNAASKGSAGNEAKAGDSVKPKQDTKSKPESSSKSDSKSEKKTESKTAKKAPAKKTAAKKTKRK